MPFCPSIFPAKFFSSAVQYFFFSTEFWDVVGLLWFVGTFLFWFVFWLIGVLCVFFCLYGGFSFGFFFKFSFVFHFFFSFAIAWLMLLLVCFVYVCITNFSLISHAEQLIKISIWDQASSLKEACSILDAL